MAKFAASGVVTVGSSNKTALGIQQPASSLKGRLSIYAVTIGSVGTPTDASLEWAIQRSSTAGTSTGVTATDIEDTGATAVALAGQTFTAEPTYVSNTLLFDMGLNQRSTYTIMWGPGFGWVIGVTASRGISVGAKHASFTSSANATGWWEE